MKRFENKTSMKPVRKMTGKAMRTSKGGLSDLQITKVVDKASPKLLL